MKRNEFDTLPEEPENKASESSKEEKTEQESANEADQVTVTVEQVKEWEEAVKQVASMEKELKESSDQHLRLLAEYDNYRKRTQKEKETILSRKRKITIGKIRLFYSACLKTSTKEIFEENSGIKGQTTIPPKSKSQ